MTTGRRGSADGPLAAFERGGSPAVAVLAGGLGARLRDTVPDRPKVLAEVSGRPFLAYVLDGLAACGLDHAVLCVGHRAEAVVQALGSRHAGLRLSYSRETRAMGTGGALRLALPALGGDPVLVLNGDSYCEVDFHALWSWHRGRDAPASMVLMRMRETGRYGSVSLGDDDRIVAFEEKRQGTGAGWINAGIYLLSRRLIEEIPEDRPVSLEHEMIPLWVDRGLYGFTGGRRFIDIGTPESYAAAASFFAPPPGQRPRA